MQIHNHININQTKESDNRILTPMETPRFTPLPGAIISPPPETNVVPFRAPINMFPDENDDVALFDTSSVY